MYDLVVVGAGPAGATLARLLGKEYKILVLERRNLLDPQPGKFTKACGGLIAPDAQYMLAILGLGVPKEVLVGPQLFTVRTIDFSSKLERYYQRHYINIDREKFDRYLVSLIPDSVDVICEAMFKSFDEKADRVIVNYLIDGQEHSVETKVLIGADGARSIIRRQLQPQDFQRSYISIQEWFRVEQVQPYFSAIFDPEISDFYSWTIPKEDQLLVGAALAPDAQAIAKFELLKKKLMEYGYDLRRRTNREGAYILRPISAGQVVLGKGRVVLIGEAAGWISPTSAEGLSYAFRSAIALAESVRNVSNDVKDLLSQYRRRTGSLKININLKNLKAPFMYHNTLRRTVLRTGLLGMDVNEPR